MLAASIKLPSASTRIGPATTGVTSVFAVVTGCPFKVSFVITFKTVFDVVPVTTVIGASSTASITFETTTVAVAVSQFDGLAPTSHI